MTSLSDKNDPVDAHSEFLQELEQRVAAIEENWGTLRSDRWDCRLLKSLYDRIHELASAATRFQLVQFGENVFSAEVYLSSFVDAPRPPSAEQTEEIDGLIRLLRSSAEQLNDPNIPTPDKPAGDRLIYLLVEPDSALAAIADHLRQRGCEVEQLAEAGEMLDALNRQVPDAMVADATFLKTFAPIASELTRLQQQLATKVSLAFVSNDNSLKTRVDAMRAGGDNYFATPFDFGEIADQIIRVAAPQHPDAYRVLLVEDDPTQAEFTTTILRKAGMETSTVTEPLKIMDALEEFHPDLILMDIYMPDINGIELTSIIRDDPDYLSMPIVFLSGEQDPEKQLDALSVGGDDFISKPIKPKHLLGIIQNRILRSINMRRAVGSDKRHDRVTGLLSRRQFLDSISKTLESPPPDSDQIAVIHIGPDQLEEIRETYGLGTTDTLMASLGNLIGKTLQPRDLACRINDTGIAALAHRATEAELHKFAQQLCSTVAAHRFTVNHEEVPFTASLGVCLFDESLKDPAGMVIRAEKARLDAGTAGGNRVTVYEAPQVQSTAAPANQNHDSVSQRLLSALHGDGFATRYQPLLHVYERGREIYQLMFKLPMPNGDFLNEHEFRDTAMQAGLGAKVDRKLVEHALRAIKTRSEEGQQLTLFVEQSGETAIDPEYPAWVADQLRNLQMVGTGLVLCYRIADISRDFKAVMQNHKELRELDVEICITRFPEKDAAFKVLNVLRAQYISVVPRLLKADADTISSVFNQAHAAGSKVLVSNIDDPRSVDLHWSSGADLLQGNFIQRPLENMDFDFYQVVA